MSGVDVAPKILVTRKMKMDRLHKAYVQEPNLEHLHYRNRMVTGAGNLDGPLIVFVRDVPREKDRNGGVSVFGQDPFVKAMIAVTGLTENEAWFTHLVKYQPFQGRPPRTGEIGASIGYLQEELKILRPQIVIPLGAQVTKALLPSYSMNEARMKRHINVGKYEVVPTFDPDMVKADPRTRGFILQDIGIIRSLI